MRQKGNLQTRLADHNVNRLIKKSSFFCANDPHGSVPPRAIAPTFRDLCFAALSSQPLIFWYRSDQENLCSIVADRPFNTRNIPYRTDTWEHNDIFMSSSEALLPALGVSPS
jgi:hypothetical protein